MRMLVLLQKIFLIFILVSSAARAQDSGSAAPSAAQENAQGGSSSSDGSSATGGHYWWVDGDIIFVAGDWIPEGGILLSIEEAGSEDLPTFGGGGGSVPDPTFPPPSDLGLPSEDLLDSLSQYNQEVQELNAQWEQIRQDADRMIADAFQRQAQSQNEMDEMERNIERTQQEAQRAAMYALIWLENLKQISQQITEDTYQNDFKSSLASAGQATNHALPDLSGLKISIPSIGPPFLVRAQGLRGMDFVTTLLSHQPQTLFEEKLHGSATLAQAAHANLVSGKEVFWQVGLEALKFSISLQRDALEVQANHFLDVGKHLLTQSQVARDTLRMGLALTPVVNDALDWYELTTGRDLISGHDIGLSGRMLSGLGLLLGSGSAYRSALKYMGKFFSPETYRQLLSHFTQSKAGQGLTQEGIQGLQKAAHQEARALVDDVVLHDPKVANRVGELIHRSDSIEVMTGKQADAAKEFASFAPEERVIFIRDMPEQVVFRGYDGGDARKSGLYAAFEDPRLMTKAEYRDKYSITKEMNQLERIAKANIRGSNGFIGKTARIEGKTTGGGVQLKLEKHMPEERWIDDGAWVE